MSKFLVSAVLFFSTFAFAQEFQSGDMIFQTSKSQQASGIFAATRSNYTHVGIVEVDDRGKKWVIEAVGPVQRIPLDKWVARGVGAKYATHRYKGLTEDQQNKIVKAAMKYKGRPYDKMFTYMDNGDAIYCSELVEMAYKDAGLKVGKRQKLGDLNIADSQAKKLIQQRWKQHPACKGLSTVEACLAEIWDDELMTPVGLTNDSNVESVSSEFTLLDRARGRLGIPPARR